MLRLPALVLLAVAFWATWAGSAAAKEGHPSAAADVRVTWPAVTDVRPGDRLTLWVRSPRRVRVALLRLSHTGRPVATIAQRRMRSGRFSVRVPAAPDVRRYLLAVDADKRRLARRITATPPAPAPVPPPPPGSSPPPPEPQPPCPGQGRSAIDFALERTSAVRGERIGMTFRNAGDTCLGYGEGYLLERLVDGHWQHTEPPYAFPSIGYGLRPGETDRQSVLTWEDMEPGRYRVIKGFDPPEGGELTGSAEFDVLAG